MNIYVRAIDYVEPTDELPAGGVVEFEDDVSDDLSLEEYGRDAWVFLEAEIGKAISGFEASFDEDFTKTAYRFVKNEAGDGFVIYDILPD